MNQFLIILIIHFLADFALQTHEQATKKSESIKFLSFHVITYSSIWFFTLLSLNYDLFDSLMFTGITYVCHFITDFVTSRIGKPFWEKQDFHNGFVVVGFDQVLHYIQLYYTFKLIDL